MKQRTDISQQLTHFTKACGDMDALDVLMKILCDRAIIGSDRFVRGGAKCVSLTEAPVETLRFGLTDHRGIVRYSPYGLQFPKKHIFHQGGRPVIYETESEYRQLSESHRWRHVRFDLSGEKEIDFTWEREWRLLCDRLDFSDREVAVVLPDESAEIQFRRRIEDESFQEAWALTTVLGDMAWLYQKPDPWRTVVIRSANLKAL